MIYMSVVQKKLNRTLAIDSTFQTFASTSCQIYRLALPLSTPETLSSLIKSRLFLNNAHLALFVRMDDTITSTNALVSIVIQ